MNQICNLRSQHFSCLICRISSGGGGSGGRQWHDSRNEEQDPRLFAVYGTYSSFWPEWRPGRSETLMPEMADKAECAFTLGVTRDKPNCGHPRYKSVNKSTSYNSAFTGTVFQETKV